MKRSTTLGLSLTLIAILTNPVRAEEVILEPAISATLRDTDNDGKGNKFFEGTVAAGDLESEGGQMHEMQRALIVFEMPKLPPNVVVAGAEFQVSLHNVQGTPGGDAVLMHLPDKDSAELRPEDFEAVPATEIDVLTTAADAARKTVYTVDVSEVVKGLYARNAIEAPVAAFRVDVKGQTAPNENDVPDRYTFRTQHDQGDMKLVLTTKPKP